MRLRDLRGDDVPITHGFAPVPGSAGSRHFEAHIFITGKDNQAVYQTDLPPAFFK
jgi:hypothetical protein